MQHPVEVSATGRQDLRVATQSIRSNSTVKQKTDKDDKECSSDRPTSAVTSCYTNSLSLTTLIQAIRQSYRQTDIIMQTLLVPQHWPSGQWVDWHCLHIQTQTTAHATASISLSTWISISH